MSISYIPRRTVLRGAGGAALALPALNIMRPKGARAAVAAPQRLVVCYAGISLGNSISTTGPWDLIVPRTIGRNYEITQGLKSITPDVKADMGLVSGLKIPWGGSPTNTSSVPPGGRVPGFHQSTKACQIGGTRCFQNDNNYQETPRGPSADQLVVDLIKGPTRFPSLPLCVTPQVTQGNIDNHTLSFLPPANKQDKWGRPMGVAVDPFISPKVLYQKLFGEVTESAGGDPLTVAKQMLDLRKGVLDAVNQKTKQLIARAGVEDRRQLERYFDRIVGLESRIRMIDPAAVASCKAPPLVNEDPAPAMGFSADPNNPEIVVSQTSNWSNETLRGRIQADCIAMAFACDLTRVVTWHFGESQCGINMFPINGAQTDMHGTGHFVPGGGLQNAAACFDWHVGHMVRLVKSLAETPDVDGRRMIDNTIILMCFEGGVGRDPGGDLDESQYRNGYRWSHSSENMVLLMAGGGGGLKTGQHIQYNLNPATAAWTSQDRHPAQVLLTAITALGYPGGALGDVKGTLPELMRLPA